ncbi:CGNR zinc finger domain-containing protein [Jatrophihabitans sp. DSM 45814]
MPSTGPRSTEHASGEPLPVELMNTIWADRADIHDALDNAAEAEAWLAAARDRIAREAETIDVPHVGKLAMGKSSTAVIGDLRQLRDALRRLAATATADPRQPAASMIADNAEAVRIVNQACAQAPAWSELTWSADNTVRRRTISAHSGAEVTLTKIAEQAATLFSSPQRVDLRACQAPGCVRYFVRDHPRREWCSASCGNRARVARHYKRHHADLDGATQ